MSCLIALVLSALQARTPVEFGQRALSEAAGPRVGDVELFVKPSAERESYSITSSGGRVKIVGSDPNGAMYGALEFAERLKNEGDRAWSAQAKGEPYLADRGLNLFLTLPWNYQKNDTDYDVAALTDPNRWWFQNEDYWRTLLDTMANSRLNWLDIHGGWDISVTNAPNLYAYFVTSPTFPKVGLPDTDKAKNLRQLNHIIELAHERGIRVSLMAYEANLRIPQNPSPPYEASEANIYVYTREVVENMIREAPGLDGIGFRIGESGRSESFFNCYLEAVKKSGRDIPLVTRSWITRKQRVLPLARNAKDFTVEIKYNGEQWGAPYMVAGGRMPNWHSYSFEDYLSDSGSEKKNAKNWPGQPAEGGGNWPSEPYKVVWQVRANGTHRILPMYNPDWVRRSIKSMKIGTASGYTIEGLDAYYPKSPDYYLADIKDKGYEWTHQRDHMYWTIWGRLGYDPDTPESVFDSEAIRMLGPGSDALVDAWKRASVLVPKAFMAYSLGPDHRNHAPELEWGGDTNAVILGQGFDTHSITPINEEFANRWTSGTDGRLKLSDIAEELGVADADFRAAEAFLSSNNGLTREIANAVRMQAKLGQYYGYRFEAALGEAKWESTVGQQSMNGAYEPYLKAEKAHEFLASTTYYKPFTERLRMHTNTFSWVTEHKNVTNESERLRKLPAYADKVVVESKSPRAPIAGDLKWIVVNGDVVCNLKAEGADRAWLLEKPLPSSTYFHRVAMKKSSTGFEARFKRRPWGHAIAAEVGKALTVRRLPDVNSERPYMIVPSLAAPTPQMYSAEEAMSYLDPSVLTTDKYAGMLIGTRGWNFFARFDRPTKRKLLAPVERGMRLVILQQDFSKYKLDWLPQPLRFEGGNWGVFDPAGQLGLEKVETADIMWQRFLPSDGWEVFGNGGLARLKVGKGEVWVTTARLMQRMYMPPAAKAFVKLLSLGGKSKPTVLVDSCSEGAEYTSSCHPDLMNSHDVPFKTLGEVIAEEQGMKSFDPIPGPVMDDDVLEGKGRDIANAFLKGQVVAMSKRPTPAKLTEFEKERGRRKKELLRSLGLDPMPQRTPLNARITGTIQMNGYHIEKLVFESRPKFYVTCHVYVPDDGATSKRPVIVDVNGHWAHKKDEDRIQLRSAFQALQGYIAIAVDSPGHSFEGNSLIERRPEGEHNDYMLVEGGTNTTGYYVWDCIRALDYMATRSDADMSRIGITGASGGGLATLYTFAADDRYKAAVPVVYMASMELAPDNGCLCNHVPATSQIGDRSDVIAIQAPKPVYIMGAQNDGEFPPNATLLTQKKMAETWALFGKSTDTYVQIFAGPHDYNQPMREAMIGFFNKHVKGEGDGSPVPQPNITVLNPEDRSILVLDPPAPGERTMRDLSKEYLSNAKKDVTVAEAIAVNGGLPKKSDLKWKESGTGKRRTVVFESEPGLKTPGILYLPKGNIKGVSIMVSDRGKHDLIQQYVPTEVVRGGFACLYLDVLGTGELAEIELRYPVYMGKSVAFIGGWQVARAVEALRKLSPHVEVLGRGPLCLQVAMWAGLMDGKLARVLGIEQMETWSDVFRDGTPEVAVQPRAHLMGSLDNLMSKVKNGVFVTSKP